MLVNLPWINQLYFGDILQSLILSPHRVPENCTYGKRGMASLCKHYYDSLKLHEVFTKRQLAPTETHFCAANDRTPSVQFGDEFYLAEDPAAWSGFTGPLEEELEAFIKDRMEHVESRIDPALQAGAVVLVDRYYFSNMAYQGARGMSPDVIRLRNEAFAPEPNLLVLLDLEPKCGLERIRTRGDRANHFEETGTLLKARQIFLGIKKPYLFVIDALKPVDEITNLSVRQFTTLQTNRIAASSLSPEQKLNATMALLGGGEL